MTKTTQVNQEVLTLLERLDYEVVSATNTITTLLEVSTDTDVLNSKMFRQYEKDYMQKFMEYDFAKQDVSKIVLAEYADKNVNVNWNLDFMTNTLTITAEEINEVPYLKQVFIEISEEDLNLLQNLYYSVEAKRSIIIKMFDRHKLDFDTKLIDSHVFKEFQKNLALNERDLEREKERLSNELLPINTNNHNINWSFNFYDCKLEINIMCECGVDLFETK